MIPPSDRRQLRFLDHLSNTVGSTDRIGCLTARTARPCSAADATFNGGASAACSKGADTTAKTGQGCLQRVPAKKDFRKSVVILTFASTRYVSDTLDEKPLTEYQCNGDRPTCARCRQRGFECRYASQDQTETRTMALKRSKKELAEEVASLKTLLGCLQSMSESSARSTLTSLRSGADPTALLRHAINSAALSKGTLSGQQVARSIVPPLQARWNLQEILQHPNAYPILDPARGADLIKSPIFQQLTKARAGEKSKNPTLIVASDSSMSLRGVSYQAFAAINAQNNHGLDALAPADLWGPTSTEFYDARLAHLNIKRWTSVPITDNYAAMAISTYLRTDHQILSLFDANLFLRDLVECRLDHCSPFLVNSLLAWASVSSQQLCTVHQ